MMLDDVKDVELVREHQRSKPVIDWTQFDSSGTDTPPEMTWVFFSTEMQPQVDRLQVKGLSNSIK